MGTAGISVFLRPGRGSVICSLLCFIFSLVMVVRALAMMSVQLATIVSGPSRNNLERLGNTFPATQMRGWAAGCGFGNHHRDQRCSYVSGRVY